MKLLMARCLNTRLVALIVLILTTVLVLSPSIYASNKLTWGKPSEVLSTDPHTSGSGTSWTVYYLIYETLTGTDDELGVVPRLAEKWENPNPTTYIFRVLSASVRSKKYSDLSRLVGYPPWGGYRA